MIKNIAIFGLGYQGQQFLRYFLKKKYNTIGICRSLKTKEKIEKEYGVTVFTNYKEVLDNKIDLLVLCAYPIDIYEEVVSFSQKYNYKILSDLPITFNQRNFQSYIENKQVFLFLQETKLYFSLHVMPYIGNKIQNIKVVIFQNKENLKQQDFRIESVIIDSHYALCNVLGNTNIQLEYKFIERVIKNIEYIVKIELGFDDYIVIYYEDGKNIFSRYKNGVNIEKKVDIIIFDDILEKYLVDINNSTNTYKKEYFAMLTYLFKKFNYV